jgi:hypothetical protein
MTNAERIARWRKRHANNLARKAARRPSQHHLPLTIRQAVFPKSLVGKMAAIISSDFK